MKSQINKGLPEQLNNHRTPMNIKYCEINTNKKGDNILTTNN